MHRLGRPEARTDPRRIDGRRFSHATNAAMRFLAVQEVSEGARPSAVMRRYGLCRTSIYRWLGRARTEGMLALAARPHPGRRPTLTDGQAASVRRWLLGSTPRDAGLDAPAWNRRLVAELVRERLGAALGPGSAGRLLRRIGLDPRAALAVATKRPGNGGGRVLLFVLDDRRGFLCLEAGRGRVALTRAVKRLRRMAGGRVHRLVQVEAPRPSVASERNV